MVWLSMFHGMVEHDVLTSGDEHGDHVEYVGQVIGDVEGVVEGEHKQVPLQHRHLLPSHVTLQGKHGRHTRLLNRLRTATVVLVRTSMK